MRKFYFPVQDSTIYERQPTRQTGLDEIIEVGKATDGSPTSNNFGAVRALLKFDFNEVSASFTTSSRYDLVLRLAFAERVDRGELIEVYPISQSWMEGAGYYYQSNIEEVNGATWISRESSSLWDVDGGTYLSYVSGSEAVEDYTRDITIDVTDVMVDCIVSGSDYGMMLKFASASEANSDNHGIMRFFSKDTHTVYRPTLVAKTPEFAYYTGSYSSSAFLQDPKIESYTLQAAYSRGETARVFINVRERYPMKTFATLFTAYTKTYYLPETSYFAVTDVASGLDVIPFDDYSRIQISGSDNYVEFNTDILYPLRLYRLKYKVVQNGTVKIIPDPKLFTIRQS